MFKQICAALIAAILVSSAAFAEGETKNDNNTKAVESTSVENKETENNGVELIDDCTDFSKCVSHSDNLFAYTVPEEDYYAYESDYTMFRRSTNTREWLMYKNAEENLRTIKYPFFKTYFKYTDNIPHFSFEVSPDGESWHEVTAQRKVTKREDWKWISVDYSLKNLESGDNFIKIVYSDLTEVEWTPMISAVGFEYDYDGYGFADCSGTPYESAAAMLCALGFAEGFNRYEFKPYNPISRAELSQLVAKILNISTQTAADRIFADVSSDYWASGAIESLFYQGIINGDENNNFNPNDTVTYIQAAKILTCALGYTAAEYGGGYPSGYRELANRLKLFDGLELPDENSAMNRGDAALMIKNALSVSILHNVTFGENSKFKKDGETLLSAYHDIKETEGVVTAYGAMSIISESVCAGGEMIIDGIKYSCDIADIGKKTALGGMLGRYVTAYVKDDRVIFSEPKNSEIKKISADKYLRTENLKLYYEDDNGKEKTAALDANTRIVYNGRYKTRVGVMKELSLNSGYIELISNGGSKTDTILIWDFNNYIAANTAALESGITDRAGGVFKPDFSKVQRLSVTAYGKESADAERTEVSKDDIIAAATSDDGEIMLIKIYNTEVSGKVNYIGTDYNNNAVLRIEGNEYSAYKDYKQLGGQVVVGTEVLAYTDINGRIFAVLCSGGYEYAYLCRAADFDEFGGEVKLKFLTAENEISDLTADDQTRLDGAAKRVKAISSLSPQLLRIKKNGKGKISEIDTADENTGVIDTSDFSLNYSAQSSKYYSGALCVFASVYQLGAQTPIFIVPKDTNDIKAYKTGDRYSLFSDYEYNVRLYDISNEYTVGAAVVFMDGSRERSVQSYDSIAYIRDCSVINNADGEACLKLDVYSNGKETAVYFDNDGGSDDTNGWIPNYTPRKTSEGNIAFHGGEVIQQYSDSESHCKSFRVLLTEDMINNNTVYEHNTGDYGAISQTDYCSELYTAYGEVKNRFSDKLIICPNLLGRLRTVALMGARVYKYDKRQKTLKPSTDAEIRTGDFVFVRMSYGDTTDIIVVSDK